MSKFLWMKVVLKYCIYRIVGKYSKIKDIICLYSENELALLSIMQVYLFAQRIHLQFT